MIWYQLESDTYVDKGYPADATQLKVNCVAATTPTVVPTASYQAAAPVPGSATTVKGAFLELQFANSSTGGAATPTTCSVAGTITVTLKGGLKATVTPK